MNKTHKTGEANVRIGPNEIFLSWTRRKKGKGATRKLNKLFFKRIIPNSDDLKGNKKYKKKEKKNTRKIIL